jgi:hypothetical protein
MRRWRHCTASLAAWHRWPCLSKRAAKPMGQALAAAGGTCRRTASPKRAPPSIIPGRARRLATARHKAIATVSAAFVAPKQNGRRVAPTADPCFVWACSGTQAAGARGAPRRWEGGVAAAVWVERLSTTRMRSASLAYRFVSSATPDATPNASVSTKPSIPGFAIA